MEDATRGRTVRQDLGLMLPGGLRQFHFSLSPMRNAKGELVGLVLEALEIPGTTAPAGVGCG